jgi:hypothetical protein
MAVCRRRPNSSVDRLRSDRVRLRSGGSPAMAGRKRWRSWVADPPRNPRVGPAARSARPIFIRRVRTVEVSCAARVSRPARAPHNRPRLRMCRADLVSTSFAAVRSTCGKCHIVKALAALALAASQEIARCTSPLLIWGSVMTRPLMALLASFALFSFLVVLNYPTTDGYQEALLASQYSP